MFGQKNRERGYRSIEQSSLDALMTLAMEFGNVALIGGKAGNVLFNLSNEGTGRVIAIG